MDQCEPNSSLYWVRGCRLEQHFPPTNEALDEPDGLLAIGGDLGSERLLRAYAAGIFPWYSDGQPILWWAPDPRSTLEPDGVHISRSLAKLIRSGRFETSFDRCFRKVVSACAAPRPPQTATWITPEMNSAYCKLHELGAAHSVECWYDGELCGGLYGVVLGSVFFGESMFSRRRDASKIAFCRLCELLSEWDYRLVDCQIHTPHLQRLGARRVERSHFEALLGTLVQRTTSLSSWKTSGTSP